MSRLEDAIRVAKRSGTAGLIPFLTAGDPDPEETPALVAALAEAGAVAVELGVPFSDPVADGIVIQRSSERALAQGVTLERVLEVVRRSRALTDVPIVLMGYLNPVLSFGVARFAREAASAGVDGVLLTDLPIEEGEDVRRALRDAGLDTVQLAAPTSGSERLPRIGAESRGFLYCISRTGVTGGRSDLPPGLAAFVAAARAATSLPIAVGFGISQPAQFRAVGTLADAVVVGSALVQTIAAATTPDRRRETAVRFLTSLTASP